jgi:class 3 adenylate cyclase/pimeloyl-ACP methyl ester carboxylesterase
MQQQIRFCITSDGARLAYAMLGDGPPLLAVSGWLSHLQLEWDEADVCTFWKGLARGRRLIRYDKRGTGLSDWDVADLSFEARVRDLKAIADALELDRFDLLGISEGGATAIAFAARHPERVRSLMLYGAYPRLPFRRDLVDVFLHAVRTEWGVGSAAYAAFAVPGNPQAAAWWSQLLRASSSGENAARILEVTLATDVTPLLASIRAPTLVAHRKGDPIHPFELAREMASRIPDARLAPLEGHIYHPWWGDSAAVLRTLNSFLGIEESAGAGVQKIEHKLLAVVSGDVVGYSRLMAEDEGGTIASMFALRSQLGSLLPSHRGQLVDFTGDDFLIEFGSAIDAVSFAAALQQALAARESEPRLELRIGVHLGDVAIQGDRRYGDGVNIAARLQQLAKPAGICISDIVHTQVRRKLALRFDDLGPQQVKNIPDPIRVYSVAADAARAGKTR